MVKHFSAKSICDHGQAFLERIPGHRLEGFQEHLVSLQVLIFNFQSA
jgi:hypothetical protein